MNPRQKRHSRLLVGIGVLVVAAGAYLSYELGRFQAGYSLVDQRRQAADFERALAERDARIDQLTREQAILETSREVDRETYAQVEQELERLQQRIQAQEEELAFYRGIVTPEDGVSGLKIQSLEIGAMEAEQHYELRLILVQAIVHSRRVSGQIRLSVSGRLLDEPKELAYDQLAQGQAAAPLDYEFRYFQTIERELVLPVGFEPDTVVVEIWPREPDADPVTQQFSWESVSG